MWCGVMWCGVVWCGVVWWGVVVASETVLMSADGGDVLDSNNSIALPAIAANDRFATTSTNVFLFL